MSIYLNKYYPVILGDTPISRQYTATNQLTLTGKPARLRVPTGISPLYFNPLRNPTTFNTDYVIRVCNSNI